MHEFASTPEQAPDAEAPVAQNTHRKDLPGCESCVVTEELVRGSSALFTILTDEGCMDECPRLKNSKKN